ncbi:hypothetical protein SLEP1_g1889 [Rubroshorea leprosula]|uniref:Protein kinase domain-containing protein n=1 Tax=Rubroshorea leprosula TaxID=152421 RepID=A0AAV5HL33_9ROSI|nr:hypothetical protein SLEP1_g1889 [Rubroshorea leprosula]
MSMVAMWCVQDSPEARPPISVVVKMLEGGVEIKPPTKPFHYLFSVRKNAVKPTAGSSFSSSEESNSYRRSVPLPAITRPSWGLEHLGAFGIVYRGQFPNGFKIVVKLLEKSSERAATNEDLMKALRL